MLKNYGVAVAELEVVWDWGRGGEPGARSRAAEERLYSVADALGARHLAVAALELEDPLEVVAERFAAVCDRAALHGLLVALEFLPWTAVADAGAAWEIVRLAGRPNGGLLVDSWHYYRGAADEAQLLSVPGDRVVAIHLDDADAEPEGDLLEDTLHRRRLPGEGAFPLAGFVQLLDRMGVTAPYGVEVISDELATLPAEEVARRAGDAARAVLAAARA